MHKYVTFSHETIVERSLSGFFFNHHTVACRSGLFLFFYQIMIGSGR